MEIRRIQIKNFKSLVDFQIDLGKFTCLVGLNGAGKSTVLQFLDFLSQLVQGDMKEWLAERKWKASDLRSKLARMENIEFRVEFVGGQEGSACWWSGVYDPTRNHCTNEKFHGPFYFLEVSNDKVTIASGLPGYHPYKNEKIAFKYEGSIVSTLKEDLLPPPVRECKEWLASVKSLELLSPERLRRPTRESSRTLRRGGLALSGLLHEMNDKDRQTLIGQLQQVYPQLENLYAKFPQPGWTQIEMVERCDRPEDATQPTMVIAARHINDGMLRLIAILAELLSEHRFLLFDEIENGINPELVEFVLNALVSSEKQVLVTTHSPMILNYLDDEIARQGVIYLYKTSRGHTKSIPFFSIPSLAEKLTVMGPGEAFVDTNLSQLGEEIAGMTEEKS